METWSIGPKIERDCPNCGSTFGAVGDFGACPKCKHVFRASPTLIALAGKLGRCDSDAILAAIAAYHKIPFVTSLSAPVCAATANRIGEWVARSETVLPVIIGGETRFATSDPMWPNVCEVLSKLIDGKPKFVVAAEDQIIIQIDQFYGVMDVEWAQA